MTSNKPQAAVIPSKGIGDALLMLIASEQLRSLGYQVTTFHDKIDSLHSWFPGHFFEKQISPDELQTFEMVIVQNDNSAKISQLRAQIRHLSIFYPSYNSQKHPPLSALDQVFNLHRPMAENIAQACARLLNLPTPSKNNGLTPPSHFLYRKNPHRLLIHPTSSKKEKNWPIRKFIQLAIELKKSGWDPVFILNQAEEEMRGQLTGSGLPIQSFDGLDQLAAYIYESAFVVGNDSLVGHLASNLKIDHLVIADNAQKMRLWRPDWHPGIIVTPSPWIPNLKFLRLREKQWKHWICVKRVLSLIPIAKRL